MESHNIPMNLRAAYLSMHRQTNAHLAPLGITADQFVCLLILDRKEGIIQRELVNRATSDPNTIRAMLVLMEANGLVTRKPHAEDRRARIVSLTDNGRRIIKEAVELLKPVRDRLESQLREEEAGLVNSYLKRINEAMR